MSLSGRPLENLNAADIESLVGLAEGLRLEFKRQIYGDADADKREFLKDVTSFANSQGGHLVIGVDETDGVASSIVPIANIDPDAEILRLENILRDSIEPRISGLGLRAVPLTGGFVVAVRVPKSGNPPHRAAYKGTNRFFGRNSAGSYELSVEELRIVFTASATGVELAKSFRTSRLALLVEGRGPVPLHPEGNWMAVHIYPLAAAGFRLDPRAARDLEVHFAPLGSDARSPRFNLDGFLNARPGDTSYGYTQVFRNGAIEATKVRILMEREGLRIMPAQTVGNALVAAIPRYLAAQEILGVPPPFAVMISMLGVQGALLGVSNEWADIDQPFDRHILELPDVVIDDYNTAPGYVALLRPAFDALWNAAGRERCTYFNELGQWRPHN
jgi:hypothetical protein